MKAIVMAAALLCACVPARADTDIYVSKRHLGDDKLHEAAQQCDWQAGPARNGEPTSAARKQCMAQHGWRFQKTVRQKEPDTWIDPETGDTCHSILNGLGSSCGNLGW